MIQGMRSGFSFFSVRPSNNQGLQGQGFNNQAYSLMPQRVQSQVSSIAANNNGFGSMTAWMAPQMGAMMSGLGNGVRNAYAGFSNWGSQVMQSAATSRAAQPSQIGQIGMLQSAMPVQQPAQTPTYTRPTLRQAMGSVTNGAKQAVQDLGTMAKEHGPAMLAMGGAMTGAGAVCSFMCGTVAATGAAMMANNMQNHVH